LTVVGCGHSRELRPAGQDRLDERTLGSARIRDRHPVADGGQVAALDGGMAKPAGELGRAFRAVLRVEDVGGPMLDGHARGLEAVVGVRGELFFEGWSPAELYKQRESLLCERERGQPKAAGDTVGAGTRCDWKERRCQTSVWLRLLLRA